VRRFVQQQKENCLKIQESAARPELVVFSQNVVGGVQSYYYNLLRYDAENKFAKTWILAEDSFDDNPKPLQPFNTGYEKIFSYRSDTPLFHILKKLNGLVADVPGIILASFPLELPLLHVYRKKNKTIGFVCHDEFFLQFAEKYNFLIDFFIVHNPHFITALQQILPQRSNDIYYLPYGIELPVVTNELNTEVPLRVLVIARMQKTKGVLDVPLIINRLAERSIPVQLTMVGDGPEKENLVQQFRNNSNVVISTPTQAELRELIPQHDIFLLPSFLDGMPVSLMETMSSGLVPVVSDFNEGIKKIVTPDKGFVLPKGNIEQFALAIEQLHTTRELLGGLRAASLTYARKQFDVTTRAKDYYSLFAQYAELKKKTRYKYIRYGNLIDHPAVPSWIHKNYYRAVTLFNQVWKR
jgi:glycosyltransferase involved in cell wall biosynthesis